MEIPNLFSTLKYPWADLSWNRHFHASERPSHSVPVCCCLVNVFIQPCDTGSPVSHACRDFLHPACALRAFRLMPGTILVLLPLDLTGCGQLVFFVLFVFVVQGWLWIVPFADRCSQEATLWQTNSATHLEWKTTCCVTITCVVTERDALRL